MRLATQCVLVCTLMLGTTGCEVATRQPQSCSDHSDCASTHYCYDGRCVVNCTSTDDCAAGRICFCDRCMPPQEACSIDNGSCHPAANCLATLDGPTCECRLGFVGDGVTCSDVNECLDDNGGCAANAECENVPGSRTCSCSSGFQGNGDLLCLQNPRLGFLTPVPTGNKLRGLYPTDGLTLFAVGEYGTIVQMAQGTWRSWPSGTTRHLNAVWAAAHNDAWAVGEGGTILRWDGLVWAPVRGLSADILTIHGASSRSVWAGGRSGAVFFWDGSTWTIRSPNTAADVTAVFAISASEAWAGTSDGTLFHWIGSSWSSVQTPRGPIHSLTGLGPESVFAGCDNGQILHWEGTSWTPFSPATPSAPVLCLTAYPNSLFAASASSQTPLLRWNGTEWVGDDQQPGFSLRSIAFTGLTLFALGTSNELAMRTAGGTWASLSSGPSFDFRSTWTSPSGTLWAAVRMPNPYSPGIVQSLDGSSWVTTSNPNGWASDVVGFADDSVFTVHGGVSEVWHWNGSTWTPLNTPNTNCAGSVCYIHQDAESLWGTSEANLWSVRGASVREFDTTPPTDRFDGVVGKWNGSGFGLSTRTDFVPHAIWGVGESPVWIAGQGGKITRWDGAAWTPQTSSTIEDLLGLWGSSPTNVWAVGKKGKIVHWDGSAWSTETSPTTKDLFVVWGLDSERVWAAGAEGTVLEYRGGVWQALESGTANALHEVALSGDGHVLFLGDKGTVLRLSD